MLFVLAFTTGMNAQETKKDCETMICCDDHSAKCTPEELAKCKAEGINCATDKSATVSADSKVCTISSSCCASGKTPPKKA